MNEIRISADSDELVVHLPKGITVKKVSSNEPSISEKAQQVAENETDDEDYEPTLKVKRKKKNTTKCEMIQNTAFVCVTCGANFSSFEKLDEHMKGPSSCRTSIITCPICNKKFPTKSRCTTHMNMHKEKPKFSCDKCGKSFSNTIALQAHLEMFHTEYFDATLNDFVCKLCHERATTKHSILRHVNSKHLDISTFLCDVCGKGFLKQSNLKTHYAIHKDEKPFECGICSKTFKLLAALKTHLQTHSDEKKFVCDECGKAFKKSNSLREHKKFHLGHFPFECSICNKRFVSKSSYNSHIKSHSVV